MTLSVSHDTLQMALLKEMLLTFCWRCKLEEESRIRLEECESDSVWLAAVCLDMKRTSKKKLQIWNELNLWAAFHDFYQVFAQHHKCTKHWPESVWIISQNIWNDPEIIDLYRKAQETLPPPNTVFPFFHMQTHNKYKIKKNSSGTVNSWHLSNHKTTEQWK